MIAAKAKERQLAGLKQNQNQTVTENSQERRTEKGETAESLAQIAGIGDLEDGPNLDNPKLEGPPQQRAGGD